VSAPRQDRVKVADPRHYGVPAEEQGGRAHALRRIAQPLVAQVIMCADGEAMGGNEVPTGKRGAIWRSSRRG
jgi:hypothetical protein